jgi:hypothetical protein
VVVRLQLLEKEKAPQLCNTVCPQCLTVAHVTPTSRDHGPSANSSS